MAYELDQSASARSRRMSWLIGIAAFSLIFGIGTALTLGKGDAPEPATSARAAVPAEAAAPAEEVVTIPTLGLSVARPRDWYTVSAEENARNLRGVEMDDRELQELVIRHAAVPIVAFSKYREPYDDVNPSFKINVRRSGALAGRPATDILSGALPTLSRAFADMKLLEGPVETKVAGHPAAYTRLGYTMRAGNKAFPTVSEFWVVPRGEIFFMLGTGTRRDERNGTRAEVRKIVDSVRLR